jgi:dolichol kinase
MQGENEDDTSLSSESQTHDRQRLRVPSRSPHPYHRRKPEQPLRLEPESHQERNEDFLPTPTQARGAVQGEGIPRRRSAKQVILTPSESGTEADDEGYGFIKALPAPPLKPRKGLRDGRASGLDGDITPLLTPTKLDVDAQRYSFDRLTSKEADNEQSSTDEEIRAARAKFVKRRRAELHRRISEVSLLGLLGFLILWNDSIRASLFSWHRGESCPHECAEGQILNNHIAELLTQLSIAVFLYLLYPIRLVAYAWRRNAPWKAIARCIRVPSAFDPAPLLYPVFMPTMVALCLTSAMPSLLLPNLVLGLSALPPQLIPGSYGEASGMLHWFLSALPLIVSEHTDIPKTLFPVEPYKLKLPPPKGLDSETIVSLFALHQALLPFLHYLTTTSLLPAELQIMSISLLNLLLFAESPQSVILEIIIWVGGLGLFLFTAPIIRWGVALARVPRWRFRRAGRIIQTQQSFIASLNHALNRSRSVGHGPRTIDSDADEDDEVDAMKPEKPKLNLDTLKAELLSLKSSIFPADDLATRSAVEPLSTKLPPLSGVPNGVMNSAKRRRNTLPTVPRIEDSPKRRRKPARSASGNVFLSLTPRQAAVRKWLYAGYVYVIMLLLILGPVDHFIARHALNGHEPFGWAIGYLLGNIRDVRFFIMDWDLNKWIPLPPLPDQEITNDLGRAEYFRKIILGEANTRLYIAAYCVAILALGMITVLRLTSVVEVDTRRKVFHGMMVAMLLPTTFIDPNFVSLALVIILTVFLILDLLRASQLPPLSKPLAYFLTPYVDGRDLRGPVVVSHMFLLIGCAIPLWLSLAGSTFSGTSPWENWDVEARDVSFIAGIICVGMGDAAASLIGRRYGRHKWPWSGGKSLEGSAAFAAAVTIGLSFGKVWLKAGQWHESDVVASSIVHTFGKTLLAACGASFMEAVLTGGNDNIVVPVVLWLFVRALGV